MIKTRLAFHSILEGILGNRNVYFQPPANIQLKYPCIVYSLTEIQEKTASNKKYKRDYSYKVTLIHKDPDNPIVDKLSNLPYSDLKSTFCTQGLNHYVFTIYYKNEKEII